MSYAESRTLGLIHEIAEGVMLDNGAYSFWRTGKPVDWPAFYQWVEPWLDHWTTWAVIPDVIDGDEVANDALVAEWPFGHKGAPAWHPHESLDRLERLVSEWPLICIGGSSVYRLGTSKWTARMAEAMDVVCDERGVPRTRLHLLRGLAYSGGPYPLYSADSTNVQRHHRGDTGRRRNPVEMVAEVDGRNPPARWHREGRQTELFAPLVGGRTPTLTKAKLHQLTIEEARDSGP